jgi:ABC-type lipoprotein export system ATPase subunit
VVTHSVELASRFPKRFEMHDQQLLPVKPGLV